MAIVEDSAWWFLKTMGRKHRRESGRTQKQVGDDIDRSEDTIRAWELGRADIPVALAALYGKACGMTDEEAYYMRKVAAARKKGKAIEADTRYNAMFLALAEEYCMSVFKFDALIIPGPLQIQEYHYKVVRLAEPLATNQFIDDGWNFKEERAHSLEARTDRPALHFLIGEIALRLLRENSEELYRSQMDHLRRWAKRPGVSIRILRGPVLAQRSNFEIYMPGENDLACPAFVYAEIADSSWCIDSPDRIASYDELRKKFWKQAIRIEVYQDEDWRDTVA